MLRILPTGLGMFRPIVSHNPCQTRFRRSTEEIFAFPLQCTGKRGYFEFRTKGACLSRHRRFDSQRFYHNVRFHIIEIFSIISMFVVLYKVIKREW
jgi:hypothetical protein